MWISALCRALKAVRICQVDNSTWPSIRPYIPPVVSLSVRCYSEEDVEDVRLLQLSDML